MLKAFTCKFVLHKFKIFKHIPNEVKNIDPTKIVLRDKSNICVILISRSSAYCIAKKDQDWPSMSFRHLRWV